MGHFMGHLTVKYVVPRHFGATVSSHVIRAVFGFNYETMKVTGPQMVLTTKLTTFAKNVDGRRKAEVRVVLYARDNC